MLQNNNPVQIYPLVLSTFVFSLLTQTQFSYPAVPQHRAWSPFLSSLSPVKAKVFQIKQLLHGVPVNLRRVLILPLRSSALMSALVVILDRGKIKPALFLIRNNLLRSKEAIID